MHDAESQGAVFVSEMSRYEVVERECASEAERTQQSGTAKTGLNKGLVTEQKEVQIPRASPHFGSLSFERVAAMKWRRRRIEKKRNSLLETTVSIHEYYTRQELARQAYRCIASTFDRCKCLGNRKSVWRK